MTDSIDYNLEGGVATITIDDGRVNVMTAALLADLRARIDQAQSDQAIILLQSGRSGIFSAGFDVRPLASGDRKASRGLLELGIEVILALLEHPYPVLSVVSGHAYPMGAFLLLASDLRIGVTGDYLIGMNEVAIGIPVPDFALELARYRLDPAHFHQAVALGQMLSPEGALDAGFLDQLVDQAGLGDLLKQSIAQLGAIDMAAHASTKRRMRSSVTEAIRSAARDRLMPTG
ncbi:MAG: crotonase/enoyl-CoA hydratase family protein [Erythrobacter sp.]|nr:crotonase/enoyl-CoA hydratase family protein [Erythrobacter sp.]MDZ4273620.1 crotonase/enoyl-CoA hydratase family protein [Erythrobacter sp.]